MMTSMRSDTDDDVVIISIDDRAGSSHSLEPSPQQQLTTTDQRRRRRTRGRRKRPPSRRGRSGSGGHTIKMAAILLSAALSMCWVVACLLVFRHNASDHHTTLHDLRHPLGNLRHDFLAYQEGLRRKREVMADNAVIKTQNAEADGATDSHFKPKPVEAGVGATAAPHRYRICKPARQRRRQPDHPQPTQGRCEPDRAALPDIDCTTGRMSTRSLTSTVWLNTCPL